MDDGKLRALLTAVECGSFSKAAARLGYTQSAMTHLVKTSSRLGLVTVARFTRPQASELAAAADAEAPDDEAVDGEAIEGEAAGESAARSTAAPS